MKTTHTPTPWHIEYLPDCDNPPFLKDVENNFAPISGRDNDQAKANAAFIIKAANLHDRMIAVLRTLANFGGVPSGEESGYDFWKEVNECIDKSNKP
jgi:hypothetical protein